MLGILFLAFIVFLWVDMYCNDNNDDVSVDVGDSDVDVPFSHHNDFMDDIDTFDITNWNIDPIAKQQHDIVFPDE